MKKFNDEKNILDKFYNFIFFGPSHILNNG